MTNICLSEEPILEYKETIQSLLIDKKRIYIKPHKNYWLFPGIPRYIDIGLDLYIPDSCIGLLTKSTYLGPYMQFDTRVIHGIEGISFVWLTNRGFLPVVLQEEQIIAELTIVPKTECHVINIKDSLE